jgi:hypothetical protein
MFGPKDNSMEEEQSNKLINKLVSYFAPNNTFVSKGAMISSTISNSSIIS